MAPALRVAVAIFAAAALSACSKEPVDSQPVDTSVKVASVGLDKPSLTLTESYTETLTATVLPENATNPALTWVSNDRGVATVDADGLVTAVMPGVAIITVFSRDGNKKANCTVTVKEAHPVFGVVAFRTENVWTVGGQTWSDAVMASRCKKQEYDGGLYNDGIAKVDCRQNTGTYGDLFSWQAVVEHQDVLCPDDWSVPTYDDFVALNEALSSSSKSYLTDWGGEYGGSVQEDGSLQFQGRSGHYWSQTPYGGTFQARFLLIMGESGNLNPTGKHYGFVLRCLKTE